MQSKELQLFINGINKAVDYVRITMGPRGRNVVMAKRYGPPSISNDGLNILRQIKFTDPYENAGAQLVIALAERMNELAGDATTTVSVLFQALVNESFRNALPGIDVMALSRGMEKAGIDIVAELEKIKRPIKTKEQVRQIATISVENKELGEMIGDTVQKVGKDGVVTVEESTEFGIRSEIVEGMEFDSGYASRGMATNDTFTVAEYRNLPILVNDKKISVFKEILPIMNLVAQKKENLADIAVVVGAKVIDDTIKLEEVKLDMLGKAQRVRSTDKLTKIIGGYGKKNQIKGRISQLKEQVKETNIKYEKEKLQERIGKLSGGVAIIHVGSPTEREAGYKKDKIEDAVNATRGAILEGIVPGGGSVFVKILKILEGRQEQNL